MLHQGLFRIIKWILTGDSRTILAEKHDTRPAMILVRLLAVIAGALGLVTLIVLIARNETSFLVIGFLAELAAVFSPTGIMVFLLVVFLVVLLVGFMIKAMIEKLIAWITTLFSIRSK